MDPAQATQAAAELSPFQSLLSETVKAVAALAGVALTAALTAVFTYLREKKKIEIRKDVEDRIRSWIPWGIARAKEWADQKIADPNDNEFPTGAMKQKVAIQTVASIVPEFEKMPADTRAALIDAKIQQLRQASLLPLPPLSVRPPPTLTASTLAAEPGAIPKAAALPTAVSAAKEP